MSSLLQTDEDVYCYHPASIKAVYIRVSGSWYVRYPSEDFDFREVLLEKDFSTGRKHTLVEYVVEPIPAETLAEVVAATLQGRIKLETAYNRVIWEEWISGSL